ncbi:MAG: septal ring lytic transglycosylase RlpA family protein [Arachidicoccus sp.]|nr:septal ring lytic transglycosylase RlpA family protein [Arachidicoccus sp.]
MDKSFFFLLCIFLSIISFSCTHYLTETGKASYYTEGKRTANGDKFKKRRLTAASKTLPFGTQVKVINLKNGKSVKVKINDRGPFVKGRIIDLSWRAAKKLDMLDDGVVPVKLKYKKP